MAKNRQPSEAAPTKLVAIPKWRKGEGPTAKQTRCERRIAKAEARRESNEYTIPLNSMVPIASLPAKARDKAIEELGEDYLSADQLVLNPRRGLIERGQTLAEKILKREDQKRRIEAKREQRRKFAALSPEEKHEHRAAGREHRAPRSLRR